jgi:hypothetical protein
MKSSAPSAAREIVAEVSARRPSRARAPDRRARRRIQSSRRRAHRPGAQDDHARARIADRFAVELEALGDDVDAVTWAKIAGLLKKAQPASVGDRALTRTCGA